MPNTGNFDLVAEITVAKLNQLLLAAYQSSKIPHSVNVPAGTTFGPYQLADGVVQISQTGLSLVMAPPTGVTITLPAQIGVQIANPPVPSLTTFNFDANIIVTLPLGQLPGPAIKIGLITDNLPLANVTVTLTSPDPVPAVTLNLISDYVNQEYANGTIPNTVSQSGVSFGAFTADAYLEVFDSQSNPSQAITVSNAAGGCEIDIPVHLRLSNLQPEGASPMGVGATLAITIPLTTTASSIATNFNEATVAVKNYGPWTGQEGTNYGIDKAGAASFGINLDQLLQSKLQSYAQQFANDLPNQTFFIPTESDIENFIAGQVQQALIQSGDIAVWTPNPPSGSPVTLNNATPRALSDAAAIGINANAGSDPTVWVDFIPSGRDFAIAINGPVIIQSINDAVRKKFGSLPTTLHNINGNDVELKSVNPALQTGQIQLTGDVTVIHAILGSINVDASYTADVGLTWQNNADGSQIIQPVTLNTSIGLSAIAWIISLLLGFVTGGIIGGVIAIVVLAIANSIASNIGGEVIRNDVTQQLLGIGAWPQTLDQIGTVTASFSNPIDIETDSVVVSG